MKRISWILFVLLIIGSMMLASCQPANTAENTEDTGEETTSEEADTDETEAEEADVEEADEGEAEEEAEAEEADAGEMSEEDKMGGTLYVTESGLVNFDTPIINDDASFHVASLVHIFLFRRLDGEVIPDFASSWDLAEDNMTYTFHLNEGWYWQDGNEVYAEGEAPEITADDVVYSVEYYYNYEGGQQTSDFMATFDHIEKVDDYTVTLYFNAPNALLFEGGRGMTSIAIIPQDAVEYYGDNWGLNPIGGGPFEFVEYVPDDHATLQRNEDYHITPYLDEVVFKVIPDQDVQRISFEAEELHILSTTEPEVFDQFANNPDYKTYSGDCPASYNIQFNLATELFQDVAVREAVAHSIDGRGIMQNQFGGLFIEGCGTAGPGIPGHDPELCDKYFVYDTTLTDGLMTDAGWEKNGNGIWEKDGVTASFELEIWNLTPAPTIAAAAVTMMQMAGFDVTLLEVEFGTWIEDMLGGNAKDTMMWSGFCGEGGLNSYWGGGGLAPLMGFSDEEVFQILEDANQEVDAEARNAMLMDATDKIFGNYPDIPLGFFTAFEISHTYVNDYYRVDWFLPIVSEGNNVWLSEK